MLTITKQKSAKTQMSKKREEFKSKEFLISQVIYPVILPTLVVDLVRDPNNFQINIKDEYY